jgi:hypothetical protein
MKDACSWSRAAAASLCLGVLMGCGAQSPSSGNSEVSDGGNTGNTGNGGNSGNSGDAGNTGNTGNTGDAGASQGSGDYTETFGPIDLPAGVETTECVVQPFGNTQPVVIQGFDSNLDPGSHHMIVYLTSAAVQSSPVACAPFTNVALGTDVPLAIITRDHISFLLPQGIGIDIPANANIRIEAHYINATANDEKGHGVVTFHTLPKATAPAYTPASFLFWGTKNITIPPSAPASTGPIFQAGPAGTHYFLATTHQHRLGTGVYVWSSAQAGDLSNQIIADKDWSNPSWKLLSPTVDFNGSNGLTFQCDWTNTTTQPVTFGESALNEMCFVGGYYYPAKGFEFCLDGLCVFR